MKKEFSYLRKGDQCYPMIDVELIGPKGSLLVKALVDSGASYSIFRAEIADYLGIPVESGHRLYFQGIKAKNLGYLLLPMMPMRKSRQSRILRLSLLNFIRHRLIPKTLFITIFIKSVAKMA